MGWLLWTVLLGARRVDVRPAGCRASPLLFSCFARDKMRWGGLRQVGSPRH